MGMCMCTFLTPVGCCFGLCLGTGFCPRTPFARLVHTLFWLTLFLVGLLGLFLPLSLGCASDDGVPWISFEWFPNKVGNDCWNELDRFKLGIAAGVFLGLGAGGLLVMVFAKPKNVETEEEEEEEDETEEEEEEEEEYDNNERNNERDDDKIPPPAPAEELPA